VSLLLRIKHSGASMSVLNTVPSPELQLSTHIACVDYIYVNSVPALTEQNEQSNTVYPILYEQKREQKYSPGN
jgi:hypothetical protein